jgi:hypothetical protein
MNRYGRKAISRVAVAALLVGATLLWGCGEKSSAGKDLQVTNAADNFQFQVTAMENYTKTYIYTWANTGDSANVDQSCSISGGKATLSLHDNAGTLVYARDLRANGSFPSGSGVAGSWRITLTLTDLTGTLNFRVQKRP